jgi:glycerophosphoryl diester phosphodiesterase
MVELDVRRTRDGRLVLFHDERIRGSRVGELDYSELSRRVGKGQPPLLEEALEVIAGRIEVDVELKEDGYVDTAVATLRKRLPPDRFRLTSFIDSALLAARQASAELRTGLLLKPPGPIELARQRLGSERGAALGASRWADALDHRVREARVDFVAPHTSLARAGILGWAAERELPSFVWTAKRCAFTTSHAGRRSRRGGDHRQAGAGDRAARSAVRREPEHRRRTRRIE